MLPETAAGSSGERNTTCTAQDGMQQVANDCNQSDGPVYLVDIGLCYEQARHSGRAIIA